MRIFIAFILFQLVHHAGAQSQFAKDFNSINKRLLNLNKTMSINNVLEANNQIVRKNIVFRMADIDNYYLTADDIEVRVVNNVKISIHHSLKVLMLDSNQSNLNRDLPVSMFDTLMSIYDEVKFEDISTTTRRYILKPKYGEYSKIEIEFNKNSFLLNKLTLYCSDEQNKIIYKLTNTYSYSPLLKTELPPSSSYYIIQNGIYKVRPKWVSYEFINHLNL